MSQFEAYHSPHKDHRNGPKLGFTETIPSLPFQQDSYEISLSHNNNSSSPFQTNNELPIGMKSSSSPSQQSKKYKPISRLNSPRTQVRFSIPIDLNDNTNRGISSNDITSPSKIVFPRESSDSESVNSNDLSFSSSISASSRIEKQDKQEVEITSEENIVRNAIQGHIVDMHSKIMVNVPEEIWAFHNERKNNNTKSHHRAKSLQDINFNTSETKILPDNFPKKGHHRSRSLQSLISQTVTEFNNNQNNTDNSNMSISFNDSQLSHVSPLNFPSNNNSNISLMTPKKNSTSLYLTSDSPINKHHVPIPLEISLPPFLSPQNKNKKRNSLIFDGESYSVFNANEEDNSQSSGESQSVSNSSQSEDTTDIVDDSLNSIASVTYNISFDGNMANPDSILGIDSDANVNLKDQFKNLKKQKQINTYKQIKKNTESRELPPVPIISHTTSSPTSTTENKRNKSSQQLQIQNSNDNNNNSKENGNTRESSQFLSPTHAKLNKMLEVYNSSTPNVSPYLPEKIKESNENENGSLAILATPSKSIIIPDLDNILLKTPDNSIPSLISSTNTSNGTLKFFDQFEPLFPSKEHNDNLISPTHNNNKNNIPHGQLDIAFKFPALKEPSLNSNKILASENNKNIPNQRISSDNIVMPQQDNDYQRTPQSSVQFEQRRQKLLASHLSPNNKVGHAHKRSRSVHNMDFMSPQKSIIADTSFPPVPFDATSTPPPQSEEPIAPRRSSLRPKSPSITPQKITEEHNHPNIVNVQTPSNSNTTHEKKMINVKPLSSFQSFSTPIKKTTLVPSIRVDEISNTRNKSYNLLSPRRQLSNSESNQSSSVNSQFSRRSHNTQLTNESETLESNINPITQPFTKPKKTKLPIDLPKQDNNDFKIVRERQANGNIIDVIVLDDEEVEVTDKRKNMSTNNNVMTKSNKKTSRPHSPKKPKSPFRRRYSSDTRESQLENYRELLTMCENTATIAKETIFELAGVKVAPMDQNGTQQSHNGYK